MNRINLIILASLLVFISGCGFHSGKTLDELTPKYTDNTSHFIELGGMNIHYRDEGQGPVILLIHGSNASLHTWEKWTDILAPNYRVISLDLPGHGLTGPHPKNEYAWPEAARFIDDFVTALEIPKFTIAGNSMGGAIAWHYALQQPAKVSSLVLIDSRGIQPEEPTPLILRAYGAPILSSLLTVFTPKWAVAENLSGVYGDPTKVSEEMISLYHDLTLREGNRDATVYRMKHPSTYELTPKLSELTMPTLIMWGEKDTWIHPKYALQFKRRIPHAQLITYSGVGHTPMEESPQKTAKDLMTFLEKKSSF